MKQPSVDLYQNIIWEQRATNYRGTVRVKLEALKFGIEGSRQLDVQNVKRLQHIFQDQGCYRLDPENRIPAVIDQQALENAMRLSDTTPAALLQIPQTSPPFLKFPAGFCLQCLKGQSRAKAAEMVLRPEERWWGIDLYLEESGPELRRALSEKFSNSSNLSDGEIYMKICHYKEANRQFDNAGHRFAETSWWSRLSNNKQENLIRLFKDHNRDYLEAFNELRVIPGIWSGFRVSKLKDLFGLRCKEQIINYLGVILAVFKAIVGGRLQWMKLADRRTVELLQLRTPGTCSTDRNHLWRLFQNKEIFPAIVLEQHRQEIWTNLLTVDVLIPSLYTLFEDIKYLKPCSMIMKRLLGDNLKDSIQQAMEEAYSGMNQTDSVVFVQETETTARSYRGSSEERVNLGITQLWLFAARNFASMVKESPRKEDGEPTPISNAPDASTWYMFANLAYSFGFVSDTILELRTRDPDKEIARQTLLDARKPQKFRYDTADFESFQEQIAGMFAAAEEVTHEPGSPSLYTSGRGEDLRRRCGRAFERAYENDRQFLFLATVLNPDENGGEGITTLFVRISVLRAFFDLPKFRTDTANAIDGPFELRSLVHDCGRGDRLREDGTRSLHNLREQVIALQRQGESLRNENELKNCKIKELECDLSQTRQNCSELDQIRSENQSMEKHLQNLAADKDKQMERTVQVEKDLMHVQQSLGEMDKLRTQNGNLQNEVARLRAELVTANEDNKQIQVLRNDLSQARRTSESHMIREGELEEEVSRLKVRLDDLSKDNGQAQDRIKELRRKNDTSQETVSNLSKEISELKNKLATSETELITNGEKLTTQALQYQEMEKSLSDELSKAQEELKHARTKLTTMTDSNSMNEMNRMRKEKSEEKIPRLQATITELKNEKNTLVAKLQNLEQTAAQINQLEEEAQKLRAENEISEQQLKVRLNDLLKDNGQAENTIKELQRKSDTSEETISNLSKEISELKSDLATSEQKLEQLKQESSNAKSTAASDIEQLQERNAVMEAEHKKLQSIMTQNKTELIANRETLTTQALQHQKNERSLTDKLSRAQKELQDIRAQLKETRDLYDVAHSTAINSMSAIEKQRTMAQEAAEEMSGLQARITELENEMRKEKNEGTILATKLQDLEQTRTVLESELVETRNQVAQLEDDVKKYQNEQIEKNHTHQEETKKLHAEIIDRDNTLRTMKEEISEHRSKDKSISEELSNMTKVQKIRTARNKKPQNLNMKLSTAKNTLEETRKEALVLQTRIAELEKEVMTARDDATREEDQRREIEKNKDKEIERLQNELKWLQKKVAVNEDIRASKKIVQDTKIHYSTLRDVNSQWITFKYYEDDGVTQHMVAERERLTADQLKRKALKLTRRTEALYLYTVNGKTLTPANAFETIEDDGTFTICVFPEGATVNGKEGRPSSRQDQSSRKRRTAVLSSLEGPYFPQSAFNSISKGVGLPNSTPVSTNITSPTTEQDCHNKQDITQCDDNGRDGNGELDNDRELDDGGEQSHDSDEDDKIS